MRAEGRERREEKNLMAVVVIQGRLLLVQNVGPV